MLKETVGAKRSPILGYNHNVRYRGIVFHVQTEDSGIVNPHVFTHLFHGGVILSTRKIVYDPDAAEEVVKSLMQAQHKAAMKDLKNGAFDEKIDQYLGGTPGLLPRGAGGGEGAPSRASSKDDASGPVVEVTIEASEPVATTAHDTLPSIPNLAMPPAEAPADPRVGRAPTERASATAPSALDGVTRRDISEAMQAIQVAPDDLARAGMPDDRSAPAQIHSPAPATAPVPPGASPERPGQYIVTRRGSGTIDPAHGPAPGPAAGPAATPATAARGTLGPKPTPPSSRLPTPAMPMPQVPRPGAPPVAPPRPAPSPPSSPSIARPTPPSVPRIAPPPARPEVAQPQPAAARPPAAPLAKPPTQPQTPRSRPVTGGVVVSRPAVIVGGPPKTVGGPPPATTTSGKVRRAKDNEGGIGGDLISERSLDEVILAYLSEDTSDE